MKIVSINVSEKELLKNAEKIVSTGIYKKPVHGPVFIDKYGIENDTIVDVSVHGGLDQAIYIYTQDDYVWWEKELNKKLEPGIFGENLTISSLGQAPITIGDHLHIGEVILEITAPRVPCFKLAARMDDSSFAKKFVKAVRPGVYARVLQEGTVNLNDTVMRVNTKNDYATTNDVFVEWHKKDRSMAVLRKALASPMASVHSERFREWLSIR